MYKVFINDNPLILTENNKFLTQYPVVDYNDANIMDTVKKLFSIDSGGINLNCNDLMMCWSNFSAHFKIQKAAGGKVFNKNNEVLFIYRFNKWDLPKGKLENDETIEECALREVEEECGLSDLTIRKPLSTTYHIFEKSDALILKITYWFKMFTTFEGELIPQTEEGIEAVEFKNKSQIQAALANTYENIKLLF